jgi:hypothetical protein
MAHPRSHARFTVGGRVRLSGRYLATGRMATMNKSTAALLMAGALLAGCSSGADSAGSAAASVSTCEVVQQQWSAYFEAARQVTSAGTGAEVRLPGGAHRRPGRVEPHRGRRQRRRQQGGGTDRHITRHRGPGGSQGDHGLGHPCSEARLRHLSGQLEGPAVVHALAYVYRPPPVRRGPTTLWNLLGLSHGHHLC